MNSDCTPISISDILTDDLITEVLVRLPVKSLLRCKSVSEPWLSLISNPNFIISHVKHTREAAQALIFCTHERSISLLHIDSCEIGDPLGDFSFVFPFVKPIGCCNGIVCLWCEPNLTKINNIYLWNPATKQVKLIPPLTIHFDNISFMYRV